MKVKIKQLETLIQKSLQVKYSNGDVKRMTDIIMFGELSGRKSHGLVRLLVGKSVLNQKPRGKPKFIRRTPISTIIEAQGNPGILAGSLACEEVIKLAKEHSIGFVGTKGTFATSGSLTYYLERITKEYLIGIIMAESETSTPPYGSTEPLFGTNPISFGIPVSPYPFIFDMATSAITYGDLLKAKTLGTKIPTNVAIDKMGKVTTDPEAAMAGATLPFDNSYKGASLAMTVEILSGLWPGAQFAGLETEQGWGNLFIAFSPDLLLSKTEFTKRMTKLLNKVRNSKPKSNETIRIPGEKTLRQRDAALKEGVVIVDDLLFQQLQQATGSQANRV